jgi:hypothetical protein
MKLAVAGNKKGGEFKLESQPGVLTCFENIFKNSKLRVFAFCSLNLVKPRTEHSPAFVKFWRLLVGVKEH